jgi:hypothetical protein
LLRAIDAKHDSQRERPLTALRRLGIVRLDHAFERCPRYHRCHLGKEHITLRALLLAAKSTKVAPVALANKIARMAWAIDEQRRALQEPAALAQ